MISYGTNSTTPPQYKAHKKCFTDGRDYYGQDVYNGKKEAKGPAHCQQICQRILWCRYFVYFHGTQEHVRKNVRAGTCLLKTGNANPIDKKGVTSGPQICRRPKSQ